MGLAFVPTPLGNLRDITLRALDVLRSADLLVAEDTRVTLRLLGALGIHSKALLSYREQNAHSVTPSILERAAAGSVAFVSDAGMPGLSDPGRALILAAREAGVAVEVLPGPSAFLCAAVLSGFELTGFSFEGFVPRAPSSRRGALQRSLENGRTSVWYESPHRIVETLGTLDELAPEADVFVARELSKLHEQTIFGTPRFVVEALEIPVRGEICLVLDGRALVRPPAVVSQERVDAELDAALASGRPLSRIAKELAARGLGERSALYARGSERKHVAEQR